MERWQEIFLDICKIPHGSGHEEQISDYIVDFAKRNGLYVFQDENYNVIIKKDASPGCESREPVALQGHIDMVCEKCADSTHDFFNDAIDCYTEGDFIKAKETTLGADNGVGVSVILAALENKEFRHPKIEAIFTVEEETTMRGALSLNTKLVSAKKLISLDHTTEGEVMVSSASLVAIEITGNAGKENTGEDYTAYKITVDGLKGGHSGVEMHMGRYNIIKIFAEIFNELKDVCDVRLVSLNAGSKVNVIANIGEMIVAVPESDAYRVQAKIQSLNFGDSDESIKINIEKTKSADTVMEKACEGCIIGFIHSVSNGIYTMSRSIEGLVQTSSNLGIVKCDDGFKLIMSVRSSKKFEEKELIDKIQKAAAENSLSFKIVSEAPAMEYKPHSPVRDVCRKVYLDMFGSEMKVVALHGGVEGAVFARKFSDMDIVLIAPNLYDVHSVNERVSISSADRVYKYLLKVLEKI